MNGILINHIVGISSMPKLSNGHKEPNYILLILFGVFLISFFCFDSYGAGRMPGEDASGKMEAAGTLLKLVDTALFIWGARIFAGIAILSAGWNLKEQRFGVAIICIVSALIFGTAPIWVKNIFDIGGGNGIFS